MRFLSITGVTCKENSLPKTHTCGGCHFGILESLHSNHTKAGVVAQAVHGGQVSGLVDASALVPRDNICPEVPKLCTGHAVMQGKATTLTYVCPTEVPGPSTVHVTVTATTTVYVVPTKTASATSIPGETSRLPYEPTSTAAPVHESTTTTTIKSTLTQYRTVTVVNKTGRSSVVNTPEIMVTSSLLPSISPKTSIAASIVTADASVVQHSIVPTTIQSLIVLPSASNGTNCSVSFTQVAANFTTGSPGPLFPNSTAHGPFGTPTLNLAREANPVTTTAAAQGLGARPGLSLMALPLNLMVAGYLI